MSWQRNQPTNDLSAPLERGRSLTDEELRAFTEQLKRKGEQKQIGRASNRRHRREGRYNAGYDR